jgi:ABC-2 type transport system permease protein
MRALLLKEFFSFFNSLIAYLVIGTFLVMSGLLMWVFPETSVLEYGFADMGTFFSFMPWLFIFLIPGITMRSFAEEKKTGTIELLVTRPLTDTRIVLAKFFAAWLLVAIALLPTLVYYITLYRLGNPPGNIDTSGVAGSYTGLLLLAMVFCAVGVLASLLSTNQIVAFVLAACGCFFLFAGFDSLSSIASWSALALPLKQLGLLYHYEAMGRGVIDSRDVVYMLSVTSLLLLVAKTILSSRTW